MTSIEATEMLNAPKLQTWINAVFDDGDSTSAIKASWSNLPPDFINYSFDSNCSKENQIPISLSSSLRSSSSITSDTLGCSHLQEKPPRAWSDAPSAKSKTPKVKFSVDQIKKRDDQDIDAEIGEVEREIGRLSTRLESLRLEKAEQTARSIAIRGRIVPAKFMDSQKQTVKIEDSSFQGANSKSTRRGVSLGPGEILSASKKSESVTPLRSAQNRRQTCFFKLPGIEEGKVTKSRGRGRTSLSLSPRSRKIKATQKQAATTVGSKRAIKKEEGILSSIQPKRLFKDEVASRKPLKPGRVVASRYSLMSKTAEKEARKRSLPENEEKENHRSEKRRVSDENSKSEGRVKKRWEIPSEVDLYSVKDETPLGKKLPKIRTLRRVGESPRDSGAAKRVAELERENRNFTFCQLLSLKNEIGIDQFE